MQNYSSSENRVTIAVYGLLLLIMVYVGRIQELIPFADKLKLGKVAFVLSALLYLIAPKSNRQPLIQFPQVKYALGIMFMALLSVPMSIWPGGSMDFILNDLLKSLFFFLILITVVSTVFEAEKVVWTVMLSAFALSISVVLGDSADRMSASSTYDPNDLAFILVTLFPLIYYYSLEKTGLKKFLLAMTMILMVIAILETVSRGGFIGLIVILLAIGLKHGKRLKSIIGPLIVFLFVLKMFAPATYWDRISTMINPTEDYNVSGEGGRIEIWESGLRMMIRNPLTGVGISCFEEGEGRQHGERGGKWMTAHNSFIQLGAELGLIGLFLFIKLLVSSIKLLREYRRLNVSGVLPSWLFDGTEVALYGYITTGFFLSQAYSPVLYLLVGLVVVSSKIVTSKRSEIVNNDVIVECKREYSLQEKL